MPPRDEKDKPLPPASRWPADGSALDSLDKLCSGPVHQLQIGLLLEAFLSVPGCFFGMPLMLLVSPSLIAMLVGNYDAASHALASSAGLVVFNSVTAMLGLWWWVHSTADARASAQRMTRMYSPALFMLAPLGGTLLLSQLEFAAPIAAAAGNLHLTTWFASILPIIELKRLARRRRPAASEPRHIGEATAAAGRAKALCAIPAMLRSGDPNTSFPSGDVAGAASVAYSLWRCGGSPTTAFACIGFSALGRLYWQAHHLLDVVCGAAISLAVCAAVDLVISGGPSASAAATCPPAEPWHAAVPLVALLTQHLVLPRLLGRPNLHAAGVRRVED